LEQRLLLSATYAITDLGTLGGPDSYATGINASGQVVGSSYTSNSTSHAFLYSAGVTIDLNSLIPADSGWTLSNANAINDRGQIVGQGINPGGQPHAFLLTLSPYVLITHSNWQPFLPAKTSFDINAQPAMPVIHAELFGADLSASESVVWKATVFYNAVDDTTQAPPVAKDIPAQVFITTLSGPDANKFTLDFPSSVGGRLVIKAFVNGNLAAKLDGLHITADNPTQTQIDDFVESFTAPAAYPDFSSDSPYEYHNIIEGIVNDESAYQQFQGMPGETNRTDPNWSGDKLGGAGLMQITNPAPTIADIWNWHQNIIDGIKKFNAAFQSNGQDLPNSLPTLSRRYRARIKQALQDSATADAVKAQGLKLVVPQISTTQYTADEATVLMGIRAFNGIGGLPVEDPVLGSSGLQEFTLILDSSGEPELTIDPVQHTATVAWREVLPKERQKQGTPNYVNKVLAADPF
jgi:probable HAF family extracellular repeat protein